MQTDQQYSFNPTTRKSYLSGDGEEIDTYGIIDDDAQQKRPSPPVHQSQLRLRLFQLAIFSLTYVNYGILHATRSSWSLASKDLITLYGFSTGSITYMNSDFLFFYSLGGFFLSHLGDRYNKNRLIFIMYTLIAIVQLALAFMGHGTDTPSQWPFYLIKALDGTFQSFAWPVNFAILCNWFPRKGRGLLIGIWATNPSLGDIFGQQLFSLMAGNSQQDWNKSFYVLSALIFSVGLVNLIFLIEYPR